MECLCAHRDEVIGEGAGVEAELGNGNGFPERSGSPCTDDTDARIRRAIAVDDAGGWIGAHADAQGVGRDVSACEQSAHERRGVVSDIGAWAGAVDHSGCAEGGGVGGCAVAHEAIDVVGV